VTVDAGKVFTAVEYIDYATSSGGIALSAFDEQSGAVLWNEMLPGNTWDPTPPVTSDGTLYLDGEGQGGTVYAVRESDGTLLWQTGELLAGNSVVLAGGTLVISGGCGLAFGLDPATGRVTWTHYEGCDGGGLLMSSFDGTSVWGEQDYGGEGSATGRVFDPSTGAVGKRFTGYAPAFGYGEALQTTLTPSATATSIQAIDPGSLTMRWSFAEPSSEKNAVGSTPLLADGYVFAVGREGQVWALSPCTGTVAWQSQVTALTLDSGWEPLPSLAAGEGYLVVPTGDGIAAFKGSGYPAGPPPNCGATTTGPTAVASSGGASSGAAPTDSTGSQTGSSTVNSFPSGVPSATASVPGSSWPSPAPASARRSAVSMVAVSVLRSQCLRERFGRRLTRGRCRVSIKVGTVGKVVARLLKGARVIAMTQVRVTHGGSLLTFSLPTSRASVYKLVITIRRDGHTVAQRSQSLHLGTA
jgi:outer membrane protein assembly factor BamB